MTIFSRIFGRALTILKDPQRSVRCLFCFVLFVCLFVCFLTGSRTRSWAHRCSPKRLKNALRGGMSLGA